MKTRYDVITDPADPRLSEIGALLKNGGTVAIPTETVYGLAANALDEAAVKNIFKAKGRPADNPLIVHIHDLAQWAPLVREIPPAAKKLAEAFWPGPLTVILKKAPCVPDVVSGGLDTVAVRMPSHPVARAILKECGVPLAAPSANRSGRPSPTDGASVREDLDGRIDAIVDAGPCSVGVESTVVSLVGDVPRILRPGGVTPEMLRVVLGPVEIDAAVLHSLADGQVAASPGMKYKHYAPEAQVVILKGDFAAYRAFVQAHRSDGTLALCFEEERSLLDVPAVTYGKAADSLSQAQKLFDALREVDARGAKRVFARFPAQDGMGLAVLNRLVRAAAFRVIDLSAPPLRVFGLTGKTGAGKSTVAEKLRHRGWYIIDTDLLARQVVEPGTPTLSALTEAFGPEILFPDGTLDRKALVRAAVARPDGVQTLNAITHPAIDDLVDDALLDAAAQGYKNVLIDAAALLESPTRRRCDVIVVVTASEATRLKRIMQRDGLSETLARERMKMQKADDYYLSAADVVIRNEPPFDLDVQLDALAASAESVPTGGTL